MNTTTAPTLANDCMDYQREKRGYEHMNELAVQNRIAELLQSCAVDDQYHREFLRSLGLGFDGAGNVNPFWRERMIFFGKVRLITAVVNSWLASDISRAAPTQHQWIPCYH